MRSLRYRIPSRHAVFLGLMILSLVAVVGPRDLLAPLRHLTQPLVYGQVGAREAGLLLSEKLRDSRIDNVSPEAHREAIELLRLYEREALALRHELESVRASRDALAGFRQAGLAEEAKLIPVHIASWDAVPGRDSLWLAGGTRQGVAPGDWVASHSETRADLPGGDVEAILPRECVLGWVDQSAGLTSRVVLLSDSRANKALRVQVEGRHGAPIDLVLQGVGGGRMRIPDIPASLVEEGLIQVGKLVTTAGEDARLPVRLVVGQITELTRHRDRRLYFDAVVKASVSPSGLHEVYVIHIENGLGPAVQP